MNYYWKSILAGIFALIAFPVLAETLSIEGGGPASLTGIVPQTYAQFTAKEGIDLQVVLGQTLTKSALKVAAGSIDLAVIPPPAFRAMTAGRGPYAENADQAKELSGNVRALFGFPGGTFHAITWADSGVNDWSDVAGKRIYIGPPAGAASGQIQALISQSSGGFKVEEDYVGLKAPWSAAQQSFQDGQFDVYVASAAVGSQILNELSLQREIRILGIPANVVGGEGWDEALKAGTLEQTVIPAGTYSGQVNGDKELITVATSMMMGVHKDMDDDTAYNLTKAYWENLQAMKEANALMRSINENDPLGNINAPLHPGALRYFRELGVNIPDNLIAN